MAELEGLLVSEVGSTRADELLVDELEEDGWNAPGQRRGRQRLEGADVEDLANHRSAAEHRSLVGAEALETRRQKGMDPGRDVDGLEVAHGNPAAVFLLEQPVVDQHRDHLLDEQRIAFRRSRDVIPDVQSGLGLTEQLRDQAVAGRIVERLEPHRRASVRRSGPSPDAVRGAPAG